MVKDELNERLVFTHGTAEWGFHRLQSQAPIRTPDGTVRVSKSYIGQKEKRNKIESSRLMLLLIE